MVQQLVRAREAGIQLVVVGSPDTMIGHAHNSVGVQQIMRLISIYHPSAAVMFRWSIVNKLDPRFNSEPPARWKMILQNIATGAKSTGSLDSPTKAWAESVSANFSAGLRQLDNAYPGKIGAIKLATFNDGLSLLLWKTLRGHIPLRENNTYGQIPQIPQIVGKFRKL